MSIIQDITNIFKTKPKKEQDTAAVDRQEKQDALHKAFSDIREQRLHGIISTLKELSMDEEVKANLKQTRHHKEFEEKVADIIKIYNGESTQDHHVNTPRGKPRGICVDL